MKIIYVKDTNALEFDKHNKEKMVFAKYFSPGCPACIAMESEWDNMCKDIDEKYDTDLILAQIDPSGMNKLEETSTHSDVAYVPSLLILNNGNKVLEYNGSKKKEDMIEFLLKEGHIKKKLKGGSKIKKLHKKKSHKNNSLKRKSHKRKSHKRKSHKRKSHKNRSHKKKQRK